MDPATYQQSWPLHLRTVRGETLSVEDQRAYEVGLKSLEAVERRPQDADQLKRLRQEIQESAAENAILHERRQNLQAEIDALQDLLNNRQPV